MSGQADSVIAVTNRIIAKDTTESGVVAALGSAKALILPPDQASATPRRTRPRRGTKRDSRWTAGGAQRLDSAAFTPGPRRRCPSSSSPSSTGILSKEKAPRCSTAARHRCCSSRPRICRGGRAAPLGGRRPRTRGQGLPSGQLPAGPGHPVPGARRSIPRPRSRSPATWPSRRGAAGRGGDGVHRGPSANPEAVDQNLGIITKYKPRVSVDAQGVLQEEDRRASCG